MDDYFKKVDNNLEIISFKLVKFLSIECNYKKWIRPSKLDKEIIILIEEKLNIKILETKYDIKSQKIIFVLG